VDKIFLLCGALTLVLQAQAATTATATPTSLTFTYQSGLATLPPAQMVSVKASSGTPAFTTGISPSAGAAPWLTVTPSSGMLPGTLTVLVNPTSLPMGIYNTASVTVTVAGVAAPLNIPVTLTVTAPPAHLTLNWATLSFAAPGTTAAQNVILSTDGLPISFTATSGAKWLLLNTPTSGSPSSAVTGVVASPANPATLTVSIDLSALLALVPQTAPYVAKITVVASGPAVAVKSQNITVNLTVNSAAPTIASVWPVNLPLNGPASWVTIIGTNFYSATLVKVQGVTGTLTPKVISASELSVQIPASLLTAPTTLRLIASNPAPGGDSTPSAGSSITVANPTAIFTNGVVSAASYASDAVSPGELVTIFGTNIGPATPAPMNITNGYVDTTLSGVTATVDGKNAPLVYASQNQVTLQVPYEATTGTNKNVVVNNGTAATAKVKINPTAPGIFTADGSGTGQAAALNYNSTTGLYTLNSNTTPAKIGDTVILYLTGEGNYNASLLTGAMVTNTGFIIPATLSPLPQMSPLPMVTIGGVDASAGVAYAGPMVGAMLGMLQINVTVPTGSATGVAVPIAVTIGGVSTQVNQPNVTLAIHP
jgi:uncharacterized protein (TIGR03437 family)